MHAFRLEKSDEYTHAASAEINFNESVYVNGWDLEKQFGVWMRLGNRINEGYAELSVCLYLPDGRVACQFQRPAITDNDKHSAGGLHYQVLEPFSAVAMRYTGELMLLDNPEQLRDPRKMFNEAQRVTANIELTLTGVSPMHGGEPAATNEDTMYGRDFSLGHFNQHTRTVGTIKLGDTTLTLDGYGWRDHSWGPRYWTNIYFYRLFVANFGADRGFMLLKRTGRDGVVHRQGVVLYDGQYEEIIDLDVITQWSPRKDPVAIQLGVRTAQRSVLLEGKVMTLAPLRNRRQVGDQSLACRIAEGFTAWRWDDGRPGIGITEYIEFLEDGEPVGYPL